MMMRIFPATLMLLAWGCHPRGEAAQVAPSAPSGEAWLTPEQVTEKLVLDGAAEHEVGGIIPASGRVTFDDLRVSHVYSPVTGRITRILAQPGQRVHKGTPLCIIQSPDVGSAFSDLAKAQADMVATQLDVNRKKYLYDAKAGSQYDYEQAVDNHGKAKAEMERAQAKARLLTRGSINRNTQEFTLAAPIDGEVVARMANPGVEVQGQYSTGSAVELFTIGEIDLVWVFADVFEMDLARIQKDQHVTVKAVAYPDKLFEGKVDWISQSLDAISRTTKVRCGIANPKRELRPEMYATVEISVSGHKALAVQRSALLRLGDQMMVFVEKGKTPNGQTIFERRRVAIDDDEDGQWVPVTHGLKPGEVVVSKGGVELLGMI